MSYKDLMRILTILFLENVVVINSAQIIAVTIPLNNNTITSGNRELFGEYFIMNNSSTLQVTLGPADKSISYVIFQAHSHLYNVTLYNNTRLYGSEITGTNLGLFTSLTKSKDTFYVVNENDFTLKVYISVHGYRSFDPIPGGENMEFPIRISPFMYAKHNRHYVKIDAQPATSPSELKFYRMYLQETSFDEDVYFQGLRSMMTLDKIIENGAEMPITNQRTPMRRMVSAYPGTGSVYVAVAYHLTKNNTFAYSVYVPVVSYACSPLVLDDCVLIDDLTSQLLCAILVFVGLFACFFGHRFFKTEMFLAGAFAGIFITYIVISMLNDLQSQALLAVSFLSGLFFGAIWLLFWWFYGIPLFSVGLSTLHFGFLVSAIMYYRIPGGSQIIHQDETFWFMFVMIMALTAVVLLTTTFASNILCCAVLGAYAAVFPIDFYLGSNLKYIVINTVRRTVVKNFNYALVDPPFQWRDLTVTLLLAGLATSGFLLQYHHNRGRPPFPPPPRSVTAPPREGVYSPRNRQRYGTIESPASPRIITVAAQPTPVNRGNRVMIDSDTTPLLQD